MRNIEYRWMTEEEIDAIGRGPSPWFIFLGLAVGFVVFLLVKLVSH